MVRLIRRTRDIRLIVLGCLLSASVDSSARFKQSRPYLTLVAAIRYMLNGLNIQPSEQSSAQRLRLVILGAPNLRLGSDRNNEEFPAEEKLTAVDLPADHGMLWIPHENLVWDREGLRLKGPFHLDEGDLCWTFGFKPNEFGHLQLALKPANPKEASRQQQEQEKMEVRLERVRAKRHNNCAPASVIVDRVQLPDKNPFCSIQGLQKFLPSVETDEEDLEGRVEGGELWEAGVYIGLQSCFESLASSLLAKGSDGYLVTDRQRASNKMFTNMRYIPAIYLRYQVYKVTAEEWRKKLLLFFPSRGKLHSAARVQGWPGLSYRNEWHATVSRMDARKQEEVEKKVMKAANSFEWLPYPDGSKLWVHLYDPKAHIHAPELGSPEDKEAGRLRSSRGRKSAGVAINWQRVMINPISNVTEEKKDVLALRKQPARLWYE